VAWASKGQLLAPQAAGEIRAMRSAETADRATGEPTLVGSHNRLSGIEGFHPALANGFSRGE